MARRPQVPSVLAEEAGASPEKMAPRRINVAINSDMLAAIDSLIDHEQVTLTEAVRRLIMYGDFVYRAVKEDKAQIIIRRGDDDGSEREIVLV